jgi:hypothetical protein
LRRGEEDHRREENQARMVHLQKERGVCCVCESAITLT